MLAKIIAQDGILDKSRRRGGVSVLLGLGELSLPDWIYSSSDLEIYGLRRGSFVTPDTHVESHNKPREEKRMKGPEIPSDDSIRGVKTKPITFPI